MTRLRRSLFNMLEGWGRSDGVGRFLNRFLIALILANVVVISFETEESLHIEFRPFFDWFEYFSVAVFTVEYLVRLWISVEEPEYSGKPAWKARLLYIFKPLTLIDLLAVLPFYLAELGLAVGFDLRVLRVLRLVRVLKLTRYSPALQSFVAVVRNERRALIAALAIMVILLVGSSSLIYLAEHKAQPEAFSSIPAAMWWAMSTLTTVGYGDVTPITPLGRLIGMVVMLTGIGLFVLYTGIIASSFSQELRKRDFMISWNMVRQVPAFAELEAIHIGEIANILHPLVVPARYMIIRQGESGNALFFILSGEVEVEIQSGPVRLGPGDFFGELGVVHQQVHMATVVAISECRLLVLEEDQLRHVMNQYPAVRRVIFEKAEQRREWIKPFGFGEEPEDL